jgi:y4mF family transcriptional regulator
MAAIGERIRERRTKLGWTQEQLAQTAGISKSFLSELESGKRSVSADKLLDLAQALGVSLDYLMTGQGNEPKHGEVHIPASLAKFAAEAGISFRQALTLLEMQRQIMFHRSASKRESLDKIDWRKFFECVKEFIE